jgi:hypothetical protein
MAAEGSGLIIKQIAGGNFDLEPDNNGIVAFPDVEHIWVLGQMDDLNAMSDNRLRRRLPCGKAAGLRFAAKAQQGGLSASSSAATTFTRPRSATPEAASAAAAAERSRVVGVGCEVGDDVLACRGLRFGAHARSFF